MLQLYVGITQYMITSQIVVILFAVGFYEPKMLNLQISCFYSEEHSNIFFYRQEHLYFHLVFVFK